MRLLPGAVAYVAASESLRSWTRWLLVTVAAVCVNFFCMIGSHDQWANEAHPSARMEIVANLFHYSTPAMAVLAAFWGIILLVVAVVRIGHKSLADRVSGVYPPARPPLEGRQERHNALVLADERIRRRTRLLQLDWALLTLDALYLANEHHSYLLLAVCGCLLAAYLLAGTVYGIYGPRPTP